MSLTGCRCNIDQFSIAGSQPVPCDADVVLKSGPDSVSATCKRPVHDFRLIATDTSRRPSRIREHALELGAQKIQYLRLCRQSIFYSHHKLHVWAIIDEAKVHKLASPVDVGQVEHFDLWKNAMLLYLRGKSLDEGRRVLVDDGRKIHRTGRQRSHVGFKKKRAASRRRVATATAGRELDNHAWAMRPHAVLYLSEKRRVR